MKIPVDYLKYLPTSLKSISFAPVEYSTSNDFNEIHSNVEDLILSIDFEDELVPILR